MTKQDIRYEWQQIVRDLEGQTPHAASIAAQLLMAQKMDMVLDQLAAMTMKLDNLQAPAAPAEPSSPFKYKGNQMDKPKLPGKNAYCACPCEGWRHYPQPNNCDCENERGFPCGCRPVAGHTIQKVDGKWRWMPSSDNASEGHVTAEGDLPF